MLRTPGKIKNHGLQTVGSDLSEVFMGLFGFYESCECLSIFLYSSICLNECPKKFGENFEMVKQSGKLFIIRELQPFDESIE